MVRKDDFPNTASPTSAKTIVKSRKGGRAKMGLENIKGEPNRRDRGSSTVLVEKPYRRELVQGLGSPLLQYRGNVHVH